MERKLIGVVGSTMYCETVGGKVWAADFLPHGAPDSEDMRKAQWRPSSIGAYYAHLNGAA